MFTVIKLMLSFNYRLVCFHHDEINLDWRTMVRLFKGSRRRPVFPAIDMRTFQQ